MIEKIKVLLVDDVEETRTNIKKLFFFAPDIEVVGEGSNGLEAVDLATSLKPDVILMDINMPVMDGIEAIEKISWQAPACSVIIMSVQGEQEYLKRAMMAGAREYLVKPFSSDELISTVRRVHEMECKRKSYFHPQLSSGNINQLSKKVITIFSSKGGVGKTTIATNLAVILAKQLQKKVAILDLDLQFGDISLVLNLVPRRTMVELVQEDGSWDQELLGRYLLNHESGLQVLPGPQRPEQAELIQENQIEKIITLLKEELDYLIIDTPPTLQGAVLTAFDNSDEVFLVTTLDLPTVKNVKLCLEVLSSLHYSRDKFKLIINQASREIGLAVNEVKEILGLPVSGEIMRDVSTVVGAANRGIPFVLSHPQTPISQSMEVLAQGITGERNGEKKSSTQKKSLLDFFRGERKDGKPCLY